MLGGAGFALGHWLGDDGLKLVLETAGAIGAINGAVGKAGGAFDRLLKTIERIAAKEPAAEARDPRPPEVKGKPPKGQARKKPTAKRVPAKGRPNGRAQEERKE